MSDEKPTIEQLSPEIAQRISEAPMPTKSTLSRRKNPFTQFFKFAFFNLRILKIVTKEKLKSD